MQVRNAGCLLSEAACLPLLLPPVQSAPLSVIGLPWLELAHDLRHLAYSTICAFMLHSQQSRRQSSSLPTDEAQWAAMRCRLMPQRLQV
jgi:hypothetical protein